MEKSSFHSGIPCVMKMKFYSFIGYSLFIKFFNFERHQFEIIKWGKIKAVYLYHQFRSSIEVRRKWKNYFTIEPPTNCQIVRLAKKIKETDSFQIIRSILLGCFRAGHFISRQTYQEFGSFVDFARFRIMHNNIWTNILTNLHLGVQFLKNHD